MNVVEVGEDTRPQWDDITDIMLIRYSAVSPTASSFTKPVSSRKKSISIPMMLPGMGRRWPL